VSGIRAVGIDRDKVRTAALNDFAGHQMAELLAAARDAGTPEQRAALAECEADLRHHKE